MEQLTKNQAVATSQEAVQNQNEPQLRDENAHNDKSVHGVLNPTYQAETIFVILVVWFLLPRVARLMIHTPTAISIFVCLSMVQLMAVFISMRCTLCGHFLQVALTLILVVGYAI